MIYVINSLIEMENLKAEWDGILNSCPDNTPFQSWEWNYGISKTYDPSELIRIIVARNEEGKIVGIAPLKLRKYLLTGIRILEFIGTRSSDYLDIIVVEGYKDYFVGELFNWIRKNKEWQIINFISLRKETIDIFSKYFSFEYSDQIVSPYISLPSSINDYKKSLPSSLLKNIRRYTNKLQSKGSLVYSTTVSTQDLYNDLNKFFELHQKRQNKKGERGHFHDKSWEENFQVLSTLLFNSGMLKIGLLKVDSVVISINFNLLLMNKEYTYLSGMEPTYAEFSPGTLLDYYMIEDAIKNGTTVYDFLQGSESYKYKWTKKELQLYTAFFSRTKFYTYVWKIPQGIRYIVYNSMIIKKLYNFILRKKSNIHIPFSNRFHF